jgi:hypothetical protein
MSRHLGILVAILAVAASCTGANTARAETVYASGFLTGKLIRYSTVDPAGTVATLSSGVLVAPATLAVGPDGNIYIGDDGDGSTVAPSIKRFDVGTNAVSTVYTFEDFSVFPGSLIFKGSDLLVGRNPLYQDVGPIVKLTGVTSGSVSKSTYTTGGDLASSPGLALGPDGSLYVADQTYASGTASGPVKRFDAAGNFVDVVIASGSSGLAGPTGLVINGSTLYTASIMTGSILQTELGTSATQLFGSTGYPFEVGALALLTSGGLLAGSPSGYTSNIYTFGPTGTLLGSFNSGLGTVGGIVTVASVPEPSTLLLSGGGLALAGWLRRRSRVGSRA